MCAAASRGVGCTMIPLAGATATRGIALSWRRERTRSAAANAFIAAITAAVSAAAAPRHRPPVIRPLKTAAR
jgi:hypothetical protein